jgi:hypothetical protein
MKIRAARVRNGVPVGAYQVIERDAPQTAPAPSGVAGRIIRAIDRADAQGRGCSGCKAVRKVARKMVKKLARPR